MLNSRITLAVLAIFAALPAIADAQPVVVRPGYVQAPFVRVYRDGYGGSRVRAPFVDVYRPGRYAPPTGSVFVRRNPWESQNYRATPSQYGPLFDAVVELDRSLSQFATADTWREYFAIVPGGALSPDVLASQPEPSPAQFAMLPRFDAIVADERYPMIAELPAFQRTRTLLSIRSRLKPAQQAPAEELPVPPPTPQNRDVENPLLQDI